MNKKRKKTKSRSIPIRRKKVLSYSPSEMEVIENHIEKIYGPIEAIIHDPDSKNLHVDLCIVAPDEDRPYWKIITMGMGKYKMTPSSNQNSTNINLNRCELVMAVEPSWDYSNLFPLDPHIIPTKPYGDSGRNYLYPIHVLKNIAMIPFSEKILLAPPATTELPGMKFDVKTDLDEFLILWSQDTKPGEEFIYLPNGEKVFFHQLVPITHKERIAMSNPANFEKTINKISYIFYPERESSV